MFMDVAVTGPVQKIVRNQDVTYPMELATVVHLGGREISVKKVRVKKIRAIQNDIFFYLCLGVPFLYIYVKNLIIFCIVCSSGYYGLRCITQCTGHCKDNEPCNHINGTCNSGCLDGWIGVNCYKRKKYKMCLLK